MNLIIALLYCCLSSNKKGLNGDLNPDFHDAGAVLQQFSYQANLLYQLIGLIVSVQIHIQAFQGTGFLVSKETVLLCWWESETKIGFCHISDSKGISLQ